MIYRIVPYMRHYGGLAWSVQQKDFLYWREVVDGLIYETAVEVVEQLIKHKGGMWEATAKGKV